MKPSSIATVALLLQLAVPAQTPASAPPAFDVASVRQDTSHTWVRRPWIPLKVTTTCPQLSSCIVGNRFSEASASLTDLMMDAYGIFRYQIENLPNWGDTGRDVYEVIAKIPGDAPPDVGQVRKMLQTLLQDRFKLQVHHQTKDLPVYALVPAKSGAKLVPANGPCALPGIPYLDAGRAATKGGEQQREASKGDAGKGGASPADDAASLLRSWALMPELLAMYTDRPVVDRSGFTAPAYCTTDGNDPLFTLIAQLPPGGGRGGEVQPRDVNSDLGANSVFTVIEEKWGMKLEPQRAPVDMIVIDHVERPSQN